MSQDKWEKTGERPDLVTGLENLALGWAMGHQTVHEVTNTETGQTGEVTTRGDETVGEAIARGVQIDEK